MCALCNVLVLSCSHGITMYMHMYQRYNPVYVLSGDPSRRRNRLLRRAHRNDTTFDTSTATVTMSWWLQTELNQSILNLYRAIKVGDDETVRKLFGQTLEEKCATTRGQQGLSAHNEFSTFQLVECQDKSGQTPLLLAARMGHELVVCTLLEKKADVHAADHVGTTSLMHASSHGHASIVRVLIKNNAALDDFRADGSTALLDATLGDHRECMKELVDAGADIESQLELARLNGYDKAIHMLLEIRASVDAVDDGRGVNIRDGPSAERTTSSRLCSLRETVSIARAEAIKCIQEAQKVLEANPPLVTELNKARIELIHMLEIHGNACGEEHVTRARKLVGAIKRETRRQKRATDRHKEHIARCENDRQCQDATDANAQAARQRIVEVIERAPLQWEEFWTSAPRDVAKKDALWARIDRVLKETDGLVDVELIQRLRQMRNSWRDSLKKEKKKMREGAKTRSENVDELVPSMASLLATSTAPASESSHSEALMEQSDGACQTHVSLLNSSAQQVVSLSQLHGAPRCANDADVDTVATSLQCVVCMSNERTHILIPCGHKCICSTCSKLPIIHEQCPMCRAQVSGVFEVFE